MANLICADCGRQLKCTKNEKAVYFANDRFAGDEYKCPECGYYVINCNSISTCEVRQNDGIRGRRSESDKWSDEEKELYDSIRVKGE